MNVEPNSCPVCGQMPCHGIVMHPGCLTAGHECHTTTGNGSTSVGFYLSKIYIREVHGFLGQCVHAQRPDFMERLIKILFPNEDGADCVGFAEADEHD